MNCNGNESGILRGIKAEGKKSVSEWSVIGAFPPNGKQQRKERKESGEEKKKTQEEREWERNYH